MLIYRKGLTQESLLVHWVQYGFPSTGTTGHWSCLHWYHGFVSNVVRVWSPAVSIRVPRGESIASPRGCSGRWSEVWSSSLSVPGPPHAEPSLKLESLVTSCNQVPVVLSGSSDMDSVSESSRPCTRVLVD